MNGAALAAVVAAATRLLARKPTAPARVTGVRWALAERLPIDGATQARRVAQARSRWTISGRLM